MQADAELIPNRLYLGSNIIYEPEVVHQNGDPTEHELSLAFTGALSYRFLPKLALGAEVQYMRAYDQGIGLNHFTGDATYVGPSLFWQIAPKNTLTLAWGRQVRGNSSETPSDHLNLVYFSRDIGKLKIEHEFSQERKMRRFAKIHYGAALAFALGSCPRFCAGGFGQRHDQE